MKLYIYDHCPFCNRVRIAAGLLDIKLEQIILPNDDIETPVNLVGKKILPILITKDGKAMGESMDIIKYLNSLPENRTKIGETANEFIEKWMQEFLPLAIKLTLPISIKIPFKEFETQLARNFYIEAKKEKFGDLDKLAEQRPELMQKIGTLFAQLDAHLAETSHNSKLEARHFSLADIDLYAFLRMLTTVKELEYPAQIENFMQLMQKHSNLRMLKDFAI